MTSSKTLLTRSQQISRSNILSELPIIPKLRTIIITCGDARVDPAHILGVELGDAVVIRNNGGRVNRAVIEELATIAFMVARMDGDQPGAFEVMVVQHTQCGAERFADAQFQALMQEHVGIDVSKSAIYDHKQSITEDIQELKNAEQLPGHIVVSGYLYNISTQQLEPVVEPASLADMRT